MDELYSASNETDGKKNPEGHGAEGRVQYVLSWLETGKLSSVHAKQELFSAVGL